MDFKYYIVRWVFADFLLQKGARLRFLFAKLLLCLRSSKKKRGSRVAPVELPWLAFSFASFLFFQREKKFISPC
jgi:hypothetical protein